MTAGTGPSQRWSPRMGYTHFPFRRHCWSSSGSARGRAVLIAVHGDADLNASRPFKDFGWFKDFRCRSPTTVRWWSA